MPSVGDPAADRDVEASLATPLRELVAETTLPDAGLGHDSDRPASVLGVPQGLVEQLELPLATEERRQAASGRRLQAGASGGRRHEREGSYRLREALDLELAELVELEEALDQYCGLRRQIGTPGLGEGLHARRQPHRVADRRVVEGLVRTDAAHDDLAGVEPHTHREVETVVAPQLAAVFRQRIAELQSGVARATSVVLVGKGGPEERHRAVAGELVDRALEADHYLRHQVVETPHHPSPGFRAHALRQLHRALDVAKQHRDLLTFPRELLRRGHPSSAERWRPGSGKTAVRGDPLLRRLVDGQLQAAPMAKPLVGRVLRTAFGARRGGDQRCAAVSAEPRGIRVLGGAARTGHLGPIVAHCSRGVNRGRRLAQSDRPSRSLPYACLGSGRLVRAPDAVRQGGHRPEGRGALRR